MNAMATPTDNQKFVLQAKDVWKSYDNKMVNVLNGVDFEARAGETIALCGPSGCGKSTLLHVLGGLDTLDNGQVFINGTALKSDGSELHRLRHEIGFVFQLHNLIPDLTLEENCLIPTVAAGTKRSVARERLMQLIERTGLAHRLGHRIQKLSGGERQRTALCRALMNRPKILLADEPTGALDERTRTQVFDLLLELVATEKITLVMATHDRTLAERCDRIALMRDGKILGI
jgi:ABC-type lipoprotein export system ATPase subunit